MKSANSLLLGVIEGFYGPPWTEAERLALFDWMAAWGLNAYLYAPKDDLKHRATWRELYSVDEAGDFRRLIEAGHARGLHFIYALSPGLDIRYSRVSDLERAQERFAQMLSLGCRHFSLLFDDIPDRLDEADRQRWDSFAAAQAAWTNHVFRWLRERQPEARLLFCPTPYCGRMVNRQLGGADYLPTLGCELVAEVEVFWTGPEIISRAITPAQVSEIGVMLRRKPIIWDNLHANDYDGRRFFCGPYTGRPRELLGEVRGVLCNPNCEFPLNYAPLRTFAEFARGEEPWDARRAWLEALAGWRRHFTTIRGELEMEDLALFADCFYLPHEEGPLAQALYDGVRRLLLQPPKDWGAQGELVRQQVARLRDVCGRMAELRNRPLFHALSRRAWELREELDLLERGLRQNSEPTITGTAFKPFSSDFHLPGTYRGGFVARLQQLLVQQADGTFLPPPITNGQGLEDDMNRESTPSGQ